MTIQKISGRITAVWIGGIITFLLTPLVASAVSLPLLNPGFETAGSATTSVASWFPYQGGYSRTTSERRTGSASIQLTNTATNQTKGAYQRINLNQTTVEPVFIGGYIKGQDIKMAPGSYFGASIYVEIYFTDGTVMYWNSLPNSGTFDWNWFGFSTGSGFTVATGLLPVNKPISHIFIIPILSSASGTAWFDDIGVTKDTPTQSAVSIVFDDSLDDHLLVAKPAMDTYGFKGTLAVVAGNLGEVGSLTMKNLKNFQTAGWEISSHSFTHQDLTAVTANRARYEIINSYQHLKNNALNVSTFAYPYGAFNSTLNIIGKPYYKSMRSFQAGDNPQGVFPYDVKVRQVVNTTTPADVAKWVAEGKANKKWEVIVFHALDTANDDIYHTDPAVFSKMLEEIKKSGVQVVTYSQGVDMFAQKSW